MKIESKKYMMGCISRNVNFLIRVFCLNFLFRRKLQKLHGILGEFRDLLEKFLVFGIFSKFCIKFCDIGYPKPNSKIFRTWFTGIKAFFLRPQAKLPRKFDPPYCIPQESLQHTP
jgi:hypothetical protein